MKARHLPGFQTVEKVFLQDSVSFFSQALFRPPSPGGSSFPFGELRQRGSAPLKPRNQAVSAGVSGHYAARHRNRQKVLATASRQERACKRTGERSVAFDEKEEQGAGGRLIF